MLPLGSSPSRIIVAIKRMERNWEAGDCSVSCFPDPLTWVRTGECKLERGEALSKISSLSIRVGSVLELAVKEA